MSSPPQGTAASSRSFSCSKRLVVVKSRKRSFEGNLEEHQRGGATAQQQKKTFDPRSQPNKEMDHDRLPSFVASKVIVHGVSESGAGSRSNGLSESGDANEEDTPSDVSGRKPSSDKRTVEFVRQFMQALVSLKPGLSEEQKQAQLLKKEEKRERKRKVNRLSAQRKRQREKQLLDDLAAKSNQLERANEALRQDNEHQSRLLQMAREFKETASGSEPLNINYPETQRLLSKLKSEFAQLESNRAALMSSAARTALGDSHREGAATRLPGMHMAAPTQPPSDVTSLQTLQLLGALLGSIIQQQQQPPPPPQPLANDLVHQLQTLVTQLQQIIPQRDQAPLPSHGPPIPMPPHAVQPQQRPTLPMPAGTFAAQQQQQQQPAPAASTAEQLAHLLQQLAGRQRPQPSVSKYGTPAPVAYHVPHTSHPQQQTQQQQEQPQQQQAPEVFFPPQQPLPFGGSPPPPQR